MTEDQYFMDLVWVISKSMITGYYCNFHSIVLMDLIFIEGLFFFNLFNINFVF